MILLVPSNPLNHKWADEQFISETVFASEMGFDVVLIDFEAVLQREAKKVVLRKGVEGQAVYRGWMLSPDDYAWLAEVLAKNGIWLKTSAKAYEKAHAWPGWYETFKHLTPFSVEVTGSLQDAFDNLSGAVIVKDHVKSMKNWDNAFFISDIRNLTKAQSVINKYTEIRGGEFVGNIVLREFEDWVGEEYRTWWVNKKHVLTTPHPDSGYAYDIPDIPLTDVAKAVIELSEWFVTVDLAKHSDGRWRVVEVGDGQVSGLPSTTSPEELLKHLM